MKQKINFKLFRANKILNLTLRWYFTSKQLSFAQQTNTVHKILQYSHNNT